MTRTFAALALSVAAAVALQDGSQAAATQTATPQTAATQPAEASPCQGIAAQPGQLGGVLKGVDRYGSTYVLVVPQRLAESIPDAKAAGVKGLHVVAEGGSAAAEAARAAGITNITEVADDTAAPFQALQDVAASKADAAVMWAPLAGLAILELGLDGAVSVYAIDRPHGAPAAYAAAGAAGPCSAAIRDELDVSGVLPAELLVPVEIRTLLDRKPPPFNIDQARQGGTAFNELCARCHGPDAVADPHGLAPVDLRISIRRFSYPGFDYIVLNGRPEKSMPPLRGTVSEEQIRMIYQYLQARSNGVLTSDKKGSE